eukprot:139998-Hanusia_phi.AAC.1
MRSSEGRTWRERKLGANCARSVFIAGKLRVTGCKNFGRFWIGIYTESVSRTIIIMASSHPSG